MKKALILFSHAEKVLEIKNQEEVEMLRKLILTMPHDTKNIRSVFESRVLFLNLDYVAGIEIKEGNEA